MGPANSIRALAYYTVIMKDLIWVFAKYTRRNKTQSSLKNVNPNDVTVTISIKIHSKGHYFLEYWPENTEKLKSLRIKVLPRLFTLGKENKAGVINQLNDKQCTVIQQSLTFKTKLRTQ